VILGVTATDVYSPDSIEEASTILGELAEKKQTVTIAGGQTALELGNAPASIDAIVSTMRLDHIVDYAPADQIVTVEAGMPLKHLQERLLPNRQRLALDPPLPARATVGGIVATDAYGPRRTRYGTARDLIVGMTIVRPDGTVARGGGKVVKNVAGFDVPKLMVGSLGTLAMIATVTLRLHPLPEAERALLFAGCGAPDVRALLNDALAAQLEPTIALAIGEGAGYALCIRFEGFRAGVDTQVASLHDVAQRRGLRAEECSPADWAPIDVAHDRTRTLGELRVKIAAPPSEFAGVHERAIAPLVAQLDEATSAAYPAIGVAFVSGTGENPGLAKTLASARDFVESLGGSLVLAAAPPEIRERIDAWGTPPAAFALMKALKQRFDPERRFNPGRFVGGL
jgi:glycolate oxidase FAD binding subunit